MAKVGDKKKCPQGHQAELKHFPESTVVMEDPAKAMKAGRSPKALTRPAYFAWVCKDCGQEWREDNVEQ